MITHKSFKTTALALLFLALTANAHGALTGLADAPLVTGSDTAVLPNLMFVLDDSGSMDWDYMPDTAKSFSGKYGFNSSHCNGVYYNPDITYNPPVDSTGASYPNANFAPGIPDASRNYGAWKDGYQTGLGTVDLSTSFTGGSGSSGSTLSARAAFYYTYTGTQTSAAQMNYQSTSGTFYTECNSAIGAAPGSSVFTKTTLSSSSAPTTTITVTGGSGATSGATITVTAANSYRAGGITVNGGQIMSGRSSSSSSTSGVATNIAVKINNCTAATTGNCTVSGYSASALGSVVTITGPAAGGSTLTISDNSGSWSKTTTAFPASVATVVSGITVNGLQLLSGATTSSTSTSAVATSIASKITAAGYSATVLGSVVTITGPSSASPWTPVITKSSGDMTLTTSAFPATNTVEQLRNFANWYSYYSNRMLMMKTGAGRAFSPISDNYRVGFLTMNNNVSPGIVEVAPFAGGCAVGSGTCQRDKWYTKLYASNPGNSTPLREALSHVGQYYAHKFGNVTYYKSTLTVGGSGETNVDSIIVNGTEIMYDTSVASTSTSTLAASIAAQINLLDTYGASVLGSVVTINGTVADLGQVPAISKTGSMTVTPTAFTASTTTSTLNGVSPADPMQYSCQQNFTILSTDGYWNGSTTYDLNGSTVGQQDGAEPRPYNDGGTQLQTTTQLTQTQTREFQSTSQLLSRTLQVQSATSNLQRQTSQLQQTNSTLKGTVSKILMRCNNTSATCGTAPATGTANANWSVVTSGTCVTAANVQCAAVNNPTALSSLQNVATSCNTAGSITNVGGTGGSATITITNVCTAGSCNGGNGASINSVTFGGTQIFSAETSDNTAQNTVATRTRDKINACTSALVGTCAATGNSATVSNNVVTITGPNVTASPVVNVSKGTATIAVSYTAGSGGTYTLNNADSNGRVYSACSYTASAAAGVSSCSAVAQSAASPYTVLAATQCNTVVTSAYANAAPCTANATPDASGFTTQCQYTAATWGNASSCNPTAQDYTAATATQCRTLYNGNATDCAAPLSADVGGVCYVGSSSACTPSGPTNGQTVTCPTPNPYTTGPTAVASCTATTAGSGNGYLQTTCSTTTVQAATGVASCTPVAPVAGNSFTTTSCNTVTVGPAAAGVCAAAAAAASNNYTATTCSAGAAGVSNTLADVAEYYYVTDLRDSSLGNCTGALGASVCSNNVPSTGLDAASWQHMTTFTLGLGARGRMVYSPSYLTDTSGDFFSVKNGVTANGSTICSWQASGACNWPIPASSSINNIDDLWHAAINGRGSYFSATDPVTLASGISSALAGISTRSGASAAATTSNPNVTSGDNFVFSSTFTTTSWDGELVRQQLDLTTGATSSTNDWCANGAEFKTVNGVTTTNCPHPYALDALAAATAKAASRTIYTWSAGAADHLQAFNETNFGANSNFNTPHISTAPDGLTQLLCAAPTICVTPAAWQTSHVYVASDRFVNASVWYQVNATYTSGAVFGATDTTNASVITSAGGNNLVNFLRGDRTNEGAETDNTKYYRSRAHILGDIVNAEAVYVKAPLFNYEDAGYTTAVSGFVALKASRQGMVYAAANDGMLHAFYAGDGTVDTATGLTPGATSITGGSEAWAYIPSLMLPNLYKLADKGYGTVGKHRYFVDGTPVVGDVCLTAPATACTGATWKTILVGGFNKGGRGYYALDITIPTAPKALWEFTDVNLGYTYGNPKITKLTDGTWVVMVTSGYNNVSNADGAGGDGVGRLFVLNAATGVPIAAINSASSSPGSISTGIGDTTTPSGLARIAVRVYDASTNNTAKAVYGGDMLGNLWRFDVSVNSRDVAAVGVYNASADIGGPGNDAQLLTTLKGPSPYPAQPITTKPELGDVDGTKVIYVGTGRYLGPDDSADHGTQSIYAIEDPLTVGTTSSTAIYANPRTLGTFKNQTPTSTTCPNGSPTTICTVGQSVRTSPNLAVSWGTDHGWYMDLPDAGERANTDPTLSLGTLGFTTNVPNSDACTVGGYSYRYFMDYKTGGAVSTSTTAVVGVKLGNALATRPVYVRLPNGVVVELTRLSTGVTATSQVPIGSGSAATRRTSWRELIEE